MGLSEKTELGGELEADRESERKSSEVSEVRRFLDGAGEAGASTEDRFTDMVDFVGEIGLSLLERW